MKSIPKADPAPEISVVIPVYNGRRFLRQAVTSVLSERLVGEVIVVDDGSTDGSVESIGDLGQDVRIIRFERNRGISEALNSGISEARYPWIGRLDADDECIPGRFTRQMAVIRRSSLDGCWSRLLLTDGDGNALGASSFHRKLSDPKLVSVALETHDVISHPSMTISKDLVTRIGGYRSLFEPAEDYDLWLRCIRNGARFAIEPGFGVKYRIHPASITSRRMLDMAVAASYARQERVPPHQFSLNTLDCVGLIDITNIAITDHQLRMAAGRQLAGRPNLSGRLRRYQRLARVPVLWWSYWSLRSLWRRLKTLVAQLAGKGGR